MQPVAMAEGRSFLTGSPRLHITDDFTLLAKAAAGGISGFEGDAEVEHGAVKETSNCFTAGRWGRNSSGMRLRDYGQTNSTTAGDYADRRVRTRFQRELATRYSSRYFENCTLRDFLIAQVEKSRRNRA